MGMKIHKNKLTPFSNFELDINKKYAIGSVGLRELRKWLNRKSLSSDYLYNEQSEYLVSLRAYPFWAEKFYDGVGAYDKFKIGPFSKDDVNVKGKLITSQKSPVLLSSIDIPRKYNNFLDFAPYTKITAFIPYISFVELDVNSIMGKRVNFYAQVDFENGLLSVWMETNNAMIQSWESHIGVDIALNRTNNTELIRNMYMWGIKSVTSTASISGDGGNRKAIKTGGDVGVSFIGTNQHHVYRGGISSGVNKLFNPTSIYLIYERQKPVETNVETNNGDNTYASLYGLPLGETYNLSLLSGFTKMGEIKINPSGYNITESEINEIESLLRTGVIL